MWPKTHELDVTDTLYTFVHIVCLLTINYYFQKDNHRLKLFIVLLPKQAHRLLYITCAKSWRDPYFFLFFFQGTKVQ